MERPLQDRQLKALVQREKKLRDVNNGRIAREADIPYGILSGWLRRPRGRLKLKHLEKLATWLGIPLSEAIAAQQGTSEEHMRELAKRIQLLSAARWSKSRRNKERLRHLTQARRGQPRSKDTKEKIRMKRLAYLARPDAYMPRGGVSLYGRLRATLRMLRRMHPAWDQNQIEEIAVNRLASRFSIKDKRDLQILLLPRVKTVGPGRPGKVDYFRVHDRHLRGEIWRSIAREFGVKSHEVLRIGWLQWRRQQSARMTTPHPP